MEDLPKYKNPIWQNKDNRHIVCQILQNNGEYTLCHVVAGPESEGGVNVDYDAIIAEYGYEKLDELTANNEEAKEKHHLLEKEKSEQHLQRHKQEILFNMKLEAFEIDLIKNSQNKELKKLIRKSKTPLEIQAYTTILIQKELENNAE